MPAESEPLLAAQRGAGEATSESNQTERWWRIAGSRRTPGIVVAAILAAGVIDGVARVVSSLNIHIPPAPYHLHALSHIPPCSDELIIA